MKRKQCSSSFWVIKLCLPFTVRVLVTLQQSTKPQRMGVSHTTSPLIERYTCFKPTEGVAQSSTSSHAHQEMLLVSYQMLHVLRCCHTAVGLTCSCTKGCKCCSTYCSYSKVPGMQFTEKDSNLVAGGIVLRPAALLGAALSCLRNTGLYMAARLGTTCKEVMNDHSIERMAQV